MEESNIDLIGLASGMLFWVTISFKYGNRDRYFRTWSLSHWAKRSVYRFHFFTYTFSM